MAEEDECYSDDERTKDTLNLENPEEYNEKDEVVEALIEKLNHDEEEVDDTEKELIKHMAKKN